MNLKEYIKEEIKKILEFEGDIAINIPPKTEMGDYSIQCASLKTEKHSNPLEIVEILKDNFEDKNHYFKEIKTMGPYLNFYVDYDILSQYVIEQIEKEREKFGSSNQGKSEALLIEHTSINPHAEPSIGRCRNGLIGDFMANLYAFTGYKVERHYFVNDIGKKIALLVIGLEKYQVNGENLTDILDVYVKISALAKKDENIENLAFSYLEKLENGDREMIDKFKKVTDRCIKGQMKVFDKLGIYFDVFTHESDYVFAHYTENILNKIKSAGKLKEAEDGRLYVDLSDYDIPTREPVLVLTRSNKTSLYPLRDLAYTIYKMERNPKNNYIVLGEDQGGAYMSQIRATMEIMGYKAPELITYSYVLLNGEKMSTSEGNLVLITDFMDLVREKIQKEFASRNATIMEDDLQTLTNACIKYSILNVSKSKIVNFNLDTATSFTGESGMYILYSIVRINSILKVNNTTERFNELKITTDLERQIIKELYRFREVIDELLISHEPAHLTKYIFNLTQEFSKFYESSNINNETNEIIKSTRLRLLEAIKTTITNGLMILGIKTVEKM